jgi:hypothetical protein
VLACAHPFTRAHVWRYRLGVRTGGSQPSNRGSNPRSATNRVAFYSLVRLVLMTPEITPIDEEPCRH